MAPIPEEDLGARVITGTALNLSLPSQCGKDIEDNDYRRGKASEKPETRSLASNHIILVWAKLNSVLRLMRMQAFAV